ncbi:hypothetical protein [Cronobacter turicensis]|uniref:hypothetical protein n=1 Tax=Cronobacter turicensis TaxID=413502 RepID=UPI003571537E
MTDHHKNLFTSFKVATLLSSDFDFTNENGRRHPLGRYNSSISSVIRSLNRIVENNNLAIQTKVYNSKLPNYETLIDSLISFMSTFMTHIEVMGGIINDFYPDKKEQDKLRKELNKSDARVFVATIINHIKHNAGTLNPASIANQKNEVALGFFVESYEDNSLGPYKLVHSMGDDIISINYFLRKVTADIFKVDNIVSSHIEKHVKNVKNEKLDEYLLTTLEKINNLPLKFFDREHHRKHLLFSMKNGKVILERLKFKRNMIIHGRISTSYISDGVTRTFRLPLGAMR